ncbi:helix-turn-helix domain-containing protein [Vibrio cholerae]|uniref:helix-turn-helix domain-containing protein n=1 Tax=Vibrio cholerae TaxID=666 RepID=UPI001E5614D7|nr:AraC family transcriptional regulator [Vibrio cholerae]MCD1211802.1 AraC family transcriptional regulator [Vibrio cholerae]MCD1214162.1 AraC family transcriptional regulator [Vibrio cholerae]MCD1232374.1 AraC family transcriptional regulator [Vibrio cholerae]MCD1239674.1 AraC family transcriptional regulator [Vibrio cholerae]MCD1245179.1 AraC family transcriptional regulator [Vibrio cholerae]
MLMIPVPFVVSLMLLLLAVTLYLRLAEQAKSACLFLVLCAATTAVVGLRWTVDWPALRMAQPILASLIPVTAWCTFTRTHEKGLSRCYKHLSGPILVLVSLLAQPFWSLPLDEILTAIYLFYGIALVRYSSQDALRIYVAFNHWENVKRAENIAGWMLLFSALIDSAMSLDFIYNQGRFSLYILTVGHVVLIPVLAFAVIVVGVSTSSSDEVANSDLATSHEEKEALTDEGMPEARAQEIVALFDRQMREKTHYLDPELTLSKLSRKLGIPAKQISAAVNQVHQKNISKLINEYRIDHALQALTQSDDSITQIFMNSGFQTKSNFNREFSRVTGMTPSDYRKQHRQI